jgi:tripartite-type tricarboxylate transporter receptor subunit TctC
MTRRYIFKGASLLCLTAGMTRPVWAETYPDRALRFIVPYTAGGGVDQMARLVAGPLSQALGQPVVLDNRGGAAGNIGTEAGVRAEPNGYTILMGAAALAINQTLYRNLPFDASKDLLPVSLLAKTPNIVVVNPKVPVRSIEELIKLAKSKPGALNYASAGSGTTPHLAAELFDSMAGVKMTHVPYKGSGPAVTALLGGQVDLMMSPALTVLPFIKAGKLRGLATTGAQRSPAFPEFPTVAESGLPGYEASQWYGVLVPAGTPRPVIDRLQKELTRIVKLPNVALALTSEGSEPIGSTPEAFADYFKAEVARWSKAIPVSERIN